MQVAEKQAQFASQSDDGLQRLPWWKDRRFPRRLGLALLGLAVTVFAVWQPPHDNPYHELTGVDWWWNPVEFNGPKRLPIIPADLHGIAVRELAKTDDGSSLPEEIWVVGAGCLVARSQDNGATWERIDVLGKSGKGRYSTELEQALLSPPWWTEAPNAVPPTPPAVSPAANDSGSGSGKNFEDAKASEDEASEDKATKSDPEEEAAVSSESRYITAAVQFKPEPKSYAKPDWGDYPMPPRNFYDITFEGEDGWIVGDGGTILHTADGGESWERQHTEIPYILNAISFVNDEIGFAVGSAETLLQTVNGGRTWASIPVEESAPVAAQFDPASSAQQQRDCFFAVEAVAPASVNSGEIRPDNVVVIFGGYSGTVFQYRRGGLAAAMVDPGDVSSMASEPGNQIQGTARISAIGAAPAASSPAGDLKFYVLRQNGLSGLTISAGGSKPYSTTTLKVPDGIDAASDVLAVPSSNVAVLAYNTTMPSVAFSGEALSTVDLADSRWIFDTDLTGVAIASTSEITSPARGSLARTSSGSLWYAGGRGFIATSSEANAAWTPVTRLMRRMDGLVAYSSVSPFPKYYSDYQAGASDVENLTDQWTGTGPYFVLAAPWYFVFLTGFIGIVIWELQTKIPPEPTRIRKSVEPVAASDRPIEKGDPDPLGFGQIAAGLCRFIRNEKTEPPLTIGLTGGWGSGKTSLMNLLKGLLEDFEFRPVWFNAWHHQQESQMLASLLTSIRANGVPGIRQPLQWLRFRFRLLWIRARHRYVWSFLLLLMSSASVAYFMSGDHSLSHAWDNLYSTVTGIVSGPAEPEPAEPSTNPDLLALRTEAGMDAQRARLLSYRIAENSKQQVKIERRLQRAVRNGDFNDGRIADADMADESARPVADDLFEKRVAFVIEDIQDIIREYPSAATSSVTTSESAAETSALIMLLSSAIGLIFSVVRGVKAFGIEPGQLLASVSGSMKIRDLSAEAGFRHHFAKEFNDVTTALAPRSLVILIDDLDRCRPEHVMETLEMVNFLVSSGRCIVVMGLAKGRVVRCIAGEFKEIAADETPEEFAVNYLEKIINVELAVPQMKREQAAQLVTERNDEKPAEESKKPKSSGSQLLESVSRLPHAARSWGRIAAVCLTLCVGWYVGSMWLGVPERNDSSQPDDGIAQASSAPAPLSGIEDGTSVTPGSQIPAGPDMTNPLGNSDINPVVKLIPGEKSSNLGDRILLFGICGVGLVLGGIAWLQQRPLVYVDSPVFANAMYIWLDVVTQKPFTPRSLKQFVNHVRFVSMRYALGVHERTRWETFIDWLHSVLIRDEKKQHVPPVVSDADAKEQQRECIFVFLCAVHNLDSRFVDDDQWWSFLSAGCIGTPPEEIGSDLCDTLRKAVDEHQRLFEHAWPISEADRTRFRGFNRDKSMSFTATVPSD